MLTKARAGRQAVRVDVSGLNAASITLAEPDDFTSLSVHVAPELDGISAAIEPWGDLMGDVAWLDIDMLWRAVAAEARAPEGLCQRFESMIAFARDHGWLDADGSRVRAHVIMQKREIA